MKITTISAACILSACCLPSFGASQPYRVAPAPSWVMRAPDGLVTAQPKPVEAGESDFPLVDQQVRLSTTTLSYSRYSQRLVSQDEVEEAAQISIEIDPGHENVSLHEIRVFRQGRAIDKLADSRRSLLNREEELEAGLINGRVTLHVLLQDVRVGDVLDYSYTVERRDPISERGYHQWFGTKWSSPVRYFRLRVMRPQDRVLYVKDESAIATPKETQRDGWTELLWEARDIAALPNESARPAWHFRYPRIEISEFASWNAVRDWALPMYALPKPDAALAPLIEEVRREPDEASRILHALRFVQDDIRYTGIEIGAGAWRPTPPRRVLERRYGDCKDKVLLLVTLLRSIGVEAWPALVHSSMGRGVDERQPSPGAFDHVIAKVRSSGRDYWLDATARDQGGRLETLVQADLGRALVLDAAANGLEQIPKRVGATPTAHVVETFDFRQGTGKVARLAVRTEYREEDADGMRVKMRNLSTSRLGEQYLDYYNRNYNRVRIASPLKVSDDRDRNLFVLEENYEIDEPFEKDENGDRTFALAAYLVTEQARKPDETVRSSPLARRFPMHVRHEIVAFLPGKWSIDGDEVSISDPAFEYKSKVKFTGGKLELEFDLRNVRDHVPVSGLGKFLTKIEKVHDDAFYTLTDNGVAGSESSEAKAGSEPTGPSIEMIFTLLCGLGLGAFALWGLLHSTWRLPAAEDGAPSGLSGWMVFPVIGVVLSPFTTGYTVWTFFHEIGAAAEFQPLRDPVKYLLLLELLLESALIVICVYAAWALFRQHRTFPFALIGMQLLGLVALLIDTITLGVIGDEVKADFESNMRSLVANGFSAAIWISYMLLSQRVRATFIGDGSGGENYRSERVPRELGAPEQPAA